MTSAARTRANKANAQKSTGPKTEAGIKKACMNGLRHGLTGQFMAMTAQDQDEFQKHCDGIVAGLAPEGYLEEQLAISIAQDQWRLHRARAIETNIFAWGHGTGPGMLDCDSEEIHMSLAQARTWMKEAKNLQLLTLYENRIRRNMEKSHAELKAMQAERKAAYTQALEEAKLLAQLSMMNREPLDTDEQLSSGVNGFAFSTREIRQILTRELRLKEANFYQINQWDRTKHFPKPGRRVPPAPLTAAHAA